MTATGYEPLNTLKPVADGLWIIDGPVRRSFAFPVPTRATVVQLANGDLWVHAPTLLTDGLRDELSALGSVRHIIAPNQSQFLNIPAWTAAYPTATFWTAPGLAVEAAKAGVSLPSGMDLQGEGAETPWQGELEQRIIRGSRAHKEAVFFHCDSATLILTDLIQAVETSKLPAHSRPFVWLSGIDDSDGKTPPLIARSFREKEAFAEDIEHMIAWHPRRVILAHGRWYRRDGVGELERAFRRVLRVRRWDRAIADMKTRERDGS